MTNAYRVQPPEDPSQPSADVSSGGGPVATDQGGVGTWEQLRWFSTLWVMALAAHFTDANPLGALSVVAFGLPVLVYPTSGWAFGLLVAYAGVSGALLLPAPSNHTMVSLLVALGFAASALCVWVTRNRSGAVAGFVVRWLAAARTPVGMTLLVVYLFTVFHKLNTAFFDPTVSCAGDLLNRLIRYNGIPIRFDPDVVQAAAIGTVVVKLAILALLAIPRWRRWGLLLGVGFHLVLAPASFWDFATMVFALYLPLVPTRVFATLAPRVTATRTIALTAFGLHLVVSAVVILAGPVTGPFGLRWHTLIVATWYVAVLPLMVQLLRACFADHGSWPGWSLRPAVLLLVPLLAFVNGATPYVGLKTVSNFSMFSNLHTEPSVANHLLPGVTSLQVLPYQRDPVTITSVEVRAARSLEAIQPNWVEKPPLTVPWLALRFIVADMRDASAKLDHVRLEYVRGGVRHVVPNALIDPELSAPLPWWQRHLIAFRAISSPDGPDKCRW